MGGAGGELRVEGAGRNSSKLVWCGVAPRNSYPVYNQNKLQNMLYSPSCIPDLALSRLSTPSGLPFSFKSFRTGLLKLLGIA